MIILTLIRNHQKTLISIPIIILLLSSCAAKNNFRYTHEEISSYPLRLQNLIKSGKLSYQMTPQQARHSWGAPDDVIVMSPDVKGRDRVKWVYKNQCFFKWCMYKTDLIFVDNKLKEIESNEPNIMDKIVPEVID